jgi:hypothetical protein
MIPIDEDLFVTICVRHGAGTLCRLSVDDFDDPEEIEITDEEIHVTAIVQRDGIEDTFPFCFKLSTTSARILIERLTRAIEERQRP